jgi:hypothetical protein
LTRVPNIAANHGAANFRWKLENRKSSETVRNDGSRKAVMLLGLFAEARSIQETEACIEIFYVDKCMRDLVEIVRLPH